jgi:hypothetical protein
VAGLALLTAGLVPIALAPAGIDPAVLVGTLVTAGTGIGLSWAPLQTAAIEAVDVAETGVASGIFSTSRYLGSIIGVSLLAGPLAPAVSGFGGFGTLFAVLVGAAAASVLLGLALPGRPCPVHVREVLQREREREAVC